MTTEATEAKTSKKKPKPANGAPAAEAEGTEPKKAEASPEEGEKKTKKRSKRKSIFVCIPTEFGDVTKTDSETGDVEVVENQPTKYAIVECPGGNGQKKAVLRALAKYDIDPLNYDTVLMFRADPIKFEISQQTIIRF